MTARWKMLDEGEDRWLVPALLLFAFTLPITISISEAMAFLVVPLWLWRRGVRAVGGPRADGFLFFTALFVCVAALASLMGTQPAHSMDKLLRLLLLAVALVVPVVDSADRHGLVERLLKAFLAGATAKAAYDVVRIPCAAWLSAQAAPPAGAGVTNVVHHVAWEDLALFSQGNMRDPQFYMVATLLLLGLWATGRVPLSKRWLWVPLLVNVLALVLHFKRGALAAAMVGVLLIAVLTRRPRLLLALAGAVAVLCATPQFRERIAMVKNEFSVSLKGRYSLWTEAAPCLLREHPFGVGWKALRYEDIRATTPHVQRGLNHLHDNLIQIAVELGWLGAVVWVAWMVAALLRHVRAWRMQRPLPGPGAGLALGLLCGFIGLLLNGLVEYNFGDTEIFMLLTLVWGCGLAFSSPPRVASA